MGRLSRLFAMSALGLVACGPAGKSPGNGGSSDMASLEVSLTGIDSEGEFYRLRNADFQIDSPYAYGDAGSSRRIVSSEDDPDAEFIRTRLLPGEYRVMLLSEDWYLERLDRDDGQFERVEQAVLLSNRSRYVYLGDGSTRTVYYRFGVDGELIDFRHGDLNIGIQVERPDDDDDGGTTSPPVDAGVGVDAGSPIRW